MATTAAAITHHETAPLARRAEVGIVGGLAGGAVFGVLMARMGILKIIASIVGSGSTLVGLGFHLMISVLIGMGLTIIFGHRLLSTLGRGAVVGVVYGAIWWVLGPLLIMPTMMGMPVLVVNGASLMTLAGHLLYGVTLAIVAVRLFKVRA